MAVLSYRPRPKPGSDITPQGDRRDGAYTWIRSNILGLVAIFIALTGSAIASQVATKQVATKQVATTARSKKGPRGPAGPPGPQGAQGLQGPAGLLTGQAGGDLTGSYPNPQIAPDAVGPSETGAVPAAKVINFLSAPTGTNTIPFPGEAFDFADMHSTVTNTGSLTAPIVGIYLVDASLAWSPPGNPDAPGSRTLTLTGEDVSNVAGDSATALPTGFTFNSASAVVSLSPGDEIHMDAGQNTGGSLGVAAQFSMVWLGPVPPV